VAVYSISTQRGGQVDETQFRWHLDFPVQGQNIDGSLLNHEGVLFQGWLLDQSDSPISLVVLSGCEVIPLTLSRPRSDVISKILGDSPEDHPKLHCGFSQQVKLKHASFSIGVVKEGRFIQLLTGAIEGKFQILKGDNGWLFLDNDTNKSIEQHTGKFRLSRTAKAEWKEYLESLTNYSLSKKLPVCLLVAPSKEMVYQQYYPYKFSKQAPIRKLTELIPDTLNFVLPIHELRNLDRRSFRVCDTHWSVHGARLASQLVSSKLSLKAVSELDIFNSDVYQRKRLSGDLGSKLFPAQLHNEDRLISFSYREKVIYDNNIDNFGRVICTFNREALLGESLLVFGSSSSYTMFDYLSRLYTNIVFVHTAGNIDHDVIEAVRPDCLCLQTNARFVVKAPKFKGSVFEYIKAKKKSGVLKSPTIAETLPEHSVPYIEFFNEMLR